MRRVRPLLLVNVVALCLRATLSAVAGPYRLSIREFRKCIKEDLDVDVSRCDLCAETIFRYNHSIASQVMDMNMTVANGVLVRGESTIKLDVSRWDTVSGWRDHFLVMPLGEMCFLVEEVAADIVQYFSKIANIPTKCPTSDGVYTTKNLVPIIPPLRRFPSLPYGRFLVYVFIGYNKLAKSKQLRSCMKMRVDVMPKV